MANGPSEEDVKLEREREPGPDGTVINGSETGAEDGQVEVKPDITLAPPKKRGRKSKDTNPA